MRLTFGRKPQVGVKEKQAICMVTLLCAQQGSVVVCCMPGHLQKTRNKTD